MHSPALSSLALPPVFAAGAAAGRGLAAMIRRLAAAGGYSSCRYYSLAGGGRSSWPVLGHFLSPKGSRCPRLLVLEIAGGLASAACWELFPAGKALCGALFLLALIAAFFIDLDHMIIPDLLTVGLALAGLGLSLAFPGLHGFAGGGAWNAARSLAAALLGMGIGSAVVLWFAVIGELVLGREVLGFGDVKFLGAIGAFCGWQGAIFALFGGAAIGAFALALSGARRALGAGGGIQLFGSSRGDTGHIGGSEPFPFGPMLASAAGLYFLGFHSFVDPFLAQYRALF